MLKAKFFRPFQVLHFIEKQLYKLELSKKWKIHNIFHMSLLEQDPTKKRQVDKKVGQIELDTGKNSGEYKIEASWDNVVYTKKSKSSHLPGLYYLVSWKEYLEEDNA